MSEPKGGPASPAPALSGSTWVYLCSASELAERGTAVRFDVRYVGETVSAFAVRVDGQPVAYLNRCAHVPTEMDWQWGEFWDGDREHLVCAIHGAAYEPHSGRCVGGPCGRGRLLPIALREQDGVVHWQTTPDITLADLPGSPPPP